jgi:hypothetical protein
LRSIPRIGRGRTSFNPATLPLAGERQNLIAGMDDMFEDGDDDMIEGKATESKD